MLHADFSMRRIASSHSVSAAHDPEPASADDIDPKGTTMRTAPGLQPTALATFLVACSCWLVSACLSYVYKDDIVTFSKGVDDTADAFDALHAKALEKYKTLKFEEFADNKDVIGVSPDCTEAVVQGQLVKDT